MRSSTEPWEEGAATHSPGWPELLGRAAVLAAGPGAAALSPASLPTTTSAPSWCWSLSSPCTWFSVAPFDPWSHRRLEGENGYFCLKIRKNRQGQAGQAQVWDTVCFCTCISLKGRTTINYLCGHEEISVPKVRYPISLFFLQLFWIFFLSETLEKKTHSHFSAYFPCNLSS